MFHTSIDISVACHALPEQIGLSYSDCTCIKFCRTYKISNILKNDKIQIIRSEHGKMEFRSLTCLPAVTLSQIQPAYSSYLQGSMNLQ